MTDSAVTKTETEVEGHGLIMHGSAVRATVRLGLMVDLGQSKYDGQVEPGDVGTYLGPHPMQNLLPGWHVLSFRQEGRTLMAPCWPGHFSLTDVEASS